MALYVGLMSGTSLDGVDGVLAEWPDQGSPRLLGHEHLPFDDSLRAALLGLNQPAMGEVHRAALAANSVAREYACVVSRLLKSTNTPQSAVAAIGAHGQTVRHRPQEFDGTGYTVQLLNGHLLAELTGIDVVGDLRGRDVAAGGQGAPLVPAVHAALFHRPGEDVAVLNLGGIANLTLLPANGPVIGFDCGPGNALLDAWCHQHTGHRFDDGGRWAASGSSDPALLRLLMDEPFLALPPPKSTGRDLFHAAWLDAALARAPHIRATDVQATLAELTVGAAVEAVIRHAPMTTRLLVCGGGAFNLHLMRRLGALLPGVLVTSTDSEGVPPDQVEALAFAWLAHRFTLRLPGNLAKVTGAAGARVLGALYPA